jgi:hypothetical protein
MADFVTLTLADKISLLTQLEQRQVLGSMKSQGSGERVTTEFTGDTAHLLNQISKLQEAIRRDPGFKDDNLLWPALMGANRPKAITRVSFGGAYGGERNPDGY